jgi:hypothetical protein
MTTVMIIFLKILFPVYLLWKFQVNSLQVIIDDFLHLIVELEQFDLIILMFCDVPDDVFPFDVTK